MIVNSYAYTLILFSGLLCVSCGGGGGNPGTCSGSAEVCGTAVAASSTALDYGFVRVPGDRLQSITCPEIKELNGNDQVRYLASARDAYERGRMNLDGDNDGIACNGSL